MEQETRPLIRINTWVTELFTEKKESKHIELKYLLSQESTPLLSAASPVLCPLFLTAVYTVVYSKTVFQQSCCDWPCILWYYCFRKGCPRKRKNARETIHRLSSGVCHCRIAFEFTFQIHVLSSFIAVIFPSSKFLTSLS